MRWSRATRPVEFASRTNSRFRRTGLTDLPASPTKRHWNPQLNRSYRTAIVTVDCGYAAV